MGRKKMDTLEKAVERLKELTNHSNETISSIELIDLSPSEFNDIMKGVTSSNGDEDDEQDDYPTQHATDEISFIEFAIINAYLYDSYKGKQKDIVVNSYGWVDGIGRLNYGGGFEITGSYWFSANIEGDDNEYMIQTKSYLDNRNELITQLHITSKKGILFKNFEDILKKIKSVSFNNSEYKGKCIKVKLREGRFRGIEIIDIQESSNELILNDTQMKFIEHFINRVSRGGNARYLLNGEPGTGKTESIREISRKLIPNVTFVIPDFSNSDDLTSIMEACEIFDNAVIIMDDIDLYLGSRDNGSYTRLLGQFLSFFDGVKKRKISLLASTNDKGLVDKAAERPGRFNFTLDYTFLDEEQIVKVCNIHLPEEWRLQEVYDALTGTINGKKVNITGAFIANLADNIKEMSEDDEEWTITDTVSLITESYKGFYSSQVEKEKQTMGFKVN
jgi:hypothetical protein